MTLGAARVIWTLVDLSMFVDEVALGYTTMVIKSQRGPIGDARIISSVDDYRRIFGLKVPYTTDPLVCEMALRQGGRLYLIRAAHYENVAVPATLQAVKSTLTLEDRGASIAHGYIESGDGPFTFIQASSGLASGTVLGPFEITATMRKVSFKVRTAGTWGSAVTATLTTGTRSASQIAAEIAALTGVLAEAHGGKVNVYCENLEDDLEVCSIDIDAYSLLGLVEGQYQHTAGEDKLFLKIDGGLGVELLSASNWTSTGWTGGWVAGWTHTAGNTTALSNTLAAEATETYEVAYTVTGRTAGTFVITFGGQTSSAKSGSGTWAPTASTTAGFVITPGSTFDGAIIVSVKKSSPIQEFTLAYNSTYSGRATTTVAGPYTFTSSNKKLSMRVRHAGTWGSTQTITFNEEEVSVATATGLIAALDDVSAVATTDDKIVIYATDVMDDIEILEISLDAYTILGLTAGVYLRIPTTLPGATFTLTATQLAAQLEAASLEGASALPSGGKLAIRTERSGSLASVQVVAGSTAAAKLGFDDAVYEGYEGFAEDTLTVDAIDEGEWGDLLRIYIYDSALNPKTHFNMRVMYLLQPNISEWYADVSMDPTDPSYVVSVVNGISNLITVTDENSSNEFFTDIGWINKPKLTDDVVGLALSGGDDGLDNFNDADWIGDGPSQTGMYAADSCQMSMDLMIPGTTSATVFQAMITYCEDRADMLGYGMIPYGLDPEDAVDWRLGNAPWSHPAFNSPRFSLWFGRPLVYDDSDNSKKYISNLGHLSACLCKTDNNYGSSWAPVGPRRGVVTLVEDVDFDIQSNRSTGYADLFAENGINYLMISRYKGIEGAMFWEQRTTFRAASARRELNVMRFVTVVNRALMPVLRTFIFEPNHPMTWREVHRTLEPAFDDWKNKYAIYDFALQTDRDAWFDGGVLKNAVLNSGLDIDRGIYHCRALIQPTRAIYYLEFSLVMTRTGEAFEQYMDTKVLPGWVTS